MPDERLVSLLWKIKSRLDELGLDDIEMTKFVDDAWYRLNLLKKHGRSEDAQLRQLAQEAEQEDVVQEIEHLEGTLQEARRDADGTTTELATTRAHAHALTFELTELEERMGGSAAERTASKEPKSARKDSKSSSWITDNSHVIVGVAVLVIIMGGIFLFRGGGVQEQSDTDRAASIGSATAAGESTPEELAALETHEVRPPLREPESSASASASAPEPEPAKATTLARVTTTEKAVHLPVTDPKVILRMHGSDTIGGKLAPALARAYLKSIGATETVLVRTGSPVEGDIQAYLPETKETIAVRIAAQGSSTAFSALGARQADIGMSSRLASSEELRRLEELYGELRIGLREAVIGLAGIAIIVNPANPIEFLTLQQIAGIFSGNITNWSEVGGKQAPIGIHARDEKSGAYHAFEQVVLKRHQQTLSEHAKRFESNAELADDVAMGHGKDVDGIGFVALPSVRRAKPIAISISDRTLPIFPTSFTVETEDYPLTRRLHFYAPESTDNPHILGMVDFALSEVGQEIVKKMGFVSQRIYAAKPSITPDMPKEYASLVRNAERLSLSLRFKFGSLELEDKAKRDIQRLQQYMEKHPGRKLMLFGFTDSPGLAKTNLELSQVRAEIVEQYLASRGLSPTVVKGFGEVLSVASNNTEVGRNKNRRVEVWVTGMLPAGDRASNGEASMPAAPTLEQRSNLSYLGTDADLIKLKHGRYDGERFEAGGDGGIGAQLTSLSTQVDVQSLYQQAIAQLADGELEKAHGILSQVLVVQPDYGPAREQIDSIRKTLADRYHEQAIRLYEQQELESAVKLWDKALELQPQHASARRHRTWAAEELCVATRECI